ncbi:hypothetical protein [Halioxenophilus sp. WMMB6]|uniref:hypothetical protein n=1 Tax=Halioxenophilus sp. WMMB6 TaxID=3073815 RepID=UPI00295EF493|nr:hypothetical protein [Halioxenophilus sp. WMMB6]
MCGGVRFKAEGDELKIYFPNPKAVMPVRRKDGSHELVAWGRRESQPGFMPKGGWARLDSIRAGKWSQYSPVPVKIDVAAFMEKDAENVSQWYELQPGEFIQGLIATLGEERRLYVVTELSENSQHASQRWPRVINEQEER